MDQTVLVIWYMYKWLCEILHMFSVAAYMCIGCVLRACCGAKNYYKAGFNLNPCFYTSLRAIISTDFFGGGPF